MEERITAGTHPIGCWHLIRSPKPLCYCKHVKEKDVIEAIERRALKRWKKECSET